MAVGRDLKVLQGGTVIAGFRNTTISWSGGSIDLTSGTDNGIRLLDAKAAQEQIDVSGEGIMRADTLRALVLNSGSKMLEDITIEFPILDENNNDAATLAGDFRITLYEESGAYNDAVTFSYTLESSGAWTYTPEAAGV